jgi:hypothetical protein
MTGWTALLTGIGLTAATAAGAIRWSRSRPGPRPHRLTDASHTHPGPHSDSMGPVAREAP